LEQNFDDVSKTLDYLPSTLSARKRTQKVGNKEEMK
jgi:hypothetical protein